MTAIEREICFVLAPAIHSPHACMVCPAVRTLGACVAHEAWFNV